MVSAFDSDTVQNREGQIATTAAQSRNDTTMVHTSIKNNFEFKKKPMFSLENIGFFLFLA